MDRRQFLAQMADVAVLALDAQEADTKCAGLAPRIPAAVLERRLANEHCVEGEI